MNRLDNLVAFQTKAYFNGICIFLANSKFPNHEYHSIYNPGMTKITKIHFL